MMKLGREEPLPSPHLLYYPPCVIPLVTQIGLINNTSSHPQKLERCICNYYIHQKECRGRIMKLLELEHILEINEAIYRQSLSDKNIEYSGKNDYPVSMDKIKKLVANTPKKSIIETATYYFKNIILLQPFPNANHRTALLAAEYFLQLNGRNLEYTKDEITSFHQTSFSIQFRIYKTYEQLGIEVLTEDENEFYQYCKKFLEDHLVV
jgi:prophage maintenance system killer protein